MTVRVRTSMPPYNPPIAHYSQLDVSQYTNEDILYAIGKGGRGFYKLTTQIGVNYLWWDKERNVVEIWGSFGALNSGAKDKLSSLLSRKISSGSSGKSISENTPSLNSSEATATPGNLQVTAC
jgi:hypothetical protein